MKTNDFLTALEDERISAAIAQAEKRTSGEIRVFVTRQQVGNMLQAAEAEFVKLGMSATEQRNGVLIYFAPVMHSYAIFGDKGVHEKCGQNFWEGISQGMNPLLKEGKFTDAIIYAVEKVGEALSRHFPWTEKDRNELPNEVVRDPEENER